jgi:hypothetical protein
LSPRVIRDLPIDPDIAPETDESPVEAEALADDSTLEAEPETVLAPTTEPTEPASDDAALAPTATADEAAADADAERAAEQDTEEYRA